MFTAQCLVAEFCTLLQYTLYVSYDFYLIITFSYTSYRVSDEACCANTCAMKTVKLHKILKQVIITHSVQDLLSNMLSQSVEVCGKNWSSAIQ